MALCRPRLPPYSRSGLLQDLDGVLRGQVGLGFARPASEVVANGVLAQLVGDLELQRLLALAEDAVLCNSTRRL